MATAQASLLSEFTVRRWGVEDGLPEARVVSVEQRSDGYLWCATPRYLARFDGVQFTLMPGEPTPVPVRIAVTNLPEQVTSDDVTSALTEPDGTLWVGTWRGLYRYRAGRWVALTARDGVFPCDARCLALDRDGNVWVGTSGGLLRLRRRRATVYRSGSSGGSESVTALWADSPSNFYVGFAGQGLFGGVPGQWHPVRFGSLHPDTTVSTLLRGRDGTLWVGTQGDGLWRQRPDGRTAQVRLKERGGMLGRGISALMEDRRGKLWVGTWRGLMQVNEDGALEAVNFRWGRTGETVQPLDTVHSLCEDDSGAVWVGYQDFGLVCFRFDGQVERFQEKDGLPGGAILVLYQDSSGALWIGTTRGLARWHGTKRSRFSMANGLADDVILQILEDDLGHLWLGTRRGLMRVRKTEFDEVEAGRKLVVAARQFGLEAGMADEECTGRLGARATRTADGHLWFPTMEGVVMVDPSEVPGPPLPPAVYVEQLRVNGTLFRWQGSTARLPLGKRDVEFSFTAPVLTAPERAHFKFQLEGLDSDWSRAAAERTARYSRLPPGTYRFQVIARDRDSDWSKPSSPLVLVVPPFFWETTWFTVTVSLAALALVGSLVGFYYRRRGLLELRRAEHQTAMERERARIARDIHDEIGAGLTEVAMLSDLAQKAPSLPEELREPLDGIFRRVCAMTQSLNEIIWAINPSHDTLESFLSYVGEFAQEFLRVANIACRLEFPENPPPVTVPSPVRHHLCLAVKEILNNVVKHADATEVRVAITCHGRELTVVIQDNGRGFEPGTVPGPAHGRNGLANLETRMAEIAGTVRQENLLGGGTRTILSVELPEDPSATDQTR